MAANGTNGYRLTILKNDTAFIKKKKFADIIFGDIIYVDRNYIEKITRICVVPK